MNELLFIRHAETGMAGTFCGHSDPPVNAAGERQIAILTEVLRAEPVAAVFTSDLQRAVRTANALAELFAVPCIARPALREIDFGQWEGLTWTQIEALDPGFAAQWLAQFPHRNPPRGESFERFEARVLAEISYLLSQFEGGSVAVVTHAGVMRVALRRLCNFDEETSWILTKPYCCNFRYAPQAPVGSRFQEVSR